MHVCSALHFSSVFIITLMFAMDAAHVSILLFIPKIFLTYSCSERVDLPL